MDASELPSHRVKLTSSSTEKARSYIQNREIPQLFEALMTGLMFKQPEDHVDYLITCLQKLKQQQQPPPQPPKSSSVNWNTFVTSPSDNNTKNAVAALNKEARAVSESQTSQVITAYSQLRSKYENPLPSIGNKPPTINMQLIFLIVPPGYSEKKAEAFSQLTSKCYDGLAVLNMSKLLMDNLETTSIDPKLKQQTLEQIKSGGNDYVSDDLSLDSAFRALVRLSNDENSHKIKTCIVEGFPRTIEQAKDWDKFGFKVSSVLIISNSEKPLSYEYNQQLSAINEFYEKKGISKKLSIDSDLNQAIKEKCLCIQKSSVAIKLASSSMHVKLFKPKQQLNILKANKG